MFDVHTHHLPENPSEVLFSCCMKDRETAAFRRARYLSAGIHPWYLTEEDMNRQLEWLDNLSVTDSSRLLALGEAGLDKCCPTPYVLQLAAFREVINRSEQFQLPLLIHCVKAFNELVRLRKEQTYQQVWIIHGFRGKRELATELLRHGFYLSFGKHFHPEALAIVPADRLLLETDECGTSVKEIYEQAALVRKTGIDELAESIDRNINSLFFSR